MNDLMKQETMSSLEIAELTGKRHDHVIRDVRKMLQDLDNPNLSGTGSYTVNNAKRTREIFNLPRDLTLTLVAGYNLQMRHKIMTRWQELEEANKPRVVKDAKLAAIIEMSYKLDETQEQAKEAKQKALMAQSTADSAMAMANKHDHIIENNVSQEVRPPKGFYSRTTIQAKLAHLFPKTHIDGLLRTYKGIRQVPCSRYVTSTLSYENYTSYSLDDTKARIEEIVATAQPVMKADGSVSKSVQSPLYGQKFIPTK